MEGESAHAWMLRCVACGTRSPPRFNFCGACGLRLARDHDSAAALPSGTASKPTAGTRERRQLSVVFCDLAGSTSLSTRLDAEDLGDVINRYFVLCKASFERHGGYVDREEGDCLRVYFGYPQARDDDPLRAARAALEVVAAVRTLGTDLGSRIPGPLEVHVGIHTGEVVAGEIDGAHDMPGPRVVGEVPNVAKRLEESAPAGTVQISAATQRLLGARFDCETVGEMALKGLPQPVLAYRLLEERGFTGAIELLAARTLAPLVGRDDELEQLGRRWAAACEGRGQVVFIGGEPGIGKSRVVHVFLARIGAAPAATHLLQCQEQFSNSAFFPLGEVLQRKLAIGRDDTPATKRAKLEAAFDADAAASAAVLLALPQQQPVRPITARAQRERALGWLAAWLLDEPAGPVVLVLEDAQWADASTLEFLGSVVDRITARRALLLVTHRPEFVPPWPLRAHLSSRMLSRLSDEEAVELVERIAPAAAASRAWVAEIVERSDGVPLYVEELTRMLVESGALARGASAARAAAPAGTVSIPQTLRGSLVARLDHLASAKPIAQTASVLGREFSFRLAQLVSGLDDAALAAGLAELVRAGLLNQRTTAPDASYAFKHALVQEAAYLSLLRSRRAHYHGRAANALLEHFPELAATRPEIVARHCAAGGRAAEAVDLWHRAGVIALEASAEVEAVGHVRSALQQIAALPAGPERTARELKCLVTLGASLAELHGYGATEVEETFSRVYHLCEGLRDSDDRYAALTGLHAFNQVRGQLRRAVEAGRDLVRIAERGDDALRRAQAHRCLGWSLFCRGEMKDAEKHLDTALGLFDRVRSNEHRRIHGMHPWVAGFANSALLHWFTGNPDTALARCREAQALALDLRNPLARAYALSVSAAVHACRAEPEATLALVREVLALAHGEGMPYWAAWASTLGGWALARLGNYSVGATQMREGLDRYRATGAQLFEPWSLGMLAEVHATAAMPEQALATIEAALASPPVADGHFYAAELYRLQGKLLRAIHADTSAAEQLTRRALALAQAQGARVFEARARAQLSD